MRPLLLALLLSGCAGPPRPRPEDLSVEPALLDGWRRVEARDRRPSPWAGWETGFVIVCDLRPASEKTADVVDRMRHDYVEGIRALQRGDLEAARRAFQDVIDAPRWWPYRIDRVVDADDLVPRAERRLARLR